MDAIVMKGRGGVQLNLVEAKWHPKVSGVRLRLSVCEPIDTRKNRKTTNAEVHGYPLDQEIFEKSKCGNYEYYSVVSYLCEVGPKAFLPHDNLDKSMEGHKQRAIASGRVDCAAKHTLSCRHHPFVSQPSRDVPHVMLHVVRLA